MEVVSEGDINNQVQTGFKTLIDAIKFSNQLQFNKSTTLAADVNKDLALITDHALSMMSKIFKHQNTKGNFLSRGTDEKLEMLCSTNDKLLDKAKENMALLNGSNMDPPPDVQRVKKIGKKFRPSLNDDDIRRTVSRLKESDDRGNNTKRYLRKSNAKKSQLLFMDKIDNSPVPFVPRLTEKPNSIVPLSLDSYTSSSGILTYFNPYTSEIDNFKILKSQLGKVTPKVPKSLDDTEFVYVDDEEKFTSMINCLENEEELAVDVENHSYRSFQGFCCLVQISSRSCDYVVDAIKLRHIMCRLNKIFTDPKIVKIFHGAELDILWLQRDFGLYVVNMFDTRQAALRLNFHRFGLAYLLQLYCKVETKKEYQLYDWRERPLPNEPLKYARMDTHYLLYIYDNLRNELLDVSDELLELVYYKSSAICKQQYEKDLKDENGFMKVYKLINKQFDNRQLLALKNLYDWRDNLAREQDESTGYVLPNHMLLQISDILPREPQGILACCNPIPKSVKKHLLKLHEIITQARTEPIVKQQSEHRRIYTEQGMIMPQQINVHDTTNSADFRNDLPTLLDGTDVVTIDQSKPSIIGFALNVFNENKSRANDSHSLKHQLSFLTPYQRYHKTVLFNEAEKEKVLAAEETSNDNEHAENKNNESDVTEDIDGAIVVDNKTVKSGTEIQVKIENDSDNVKIKQEKTETLDTIEIINSNRSQTSKKKKMIDKKRKSGDGIPFTDTVSTSAYTGLENVKQKKKIKIEPIDADNNVPTTSAAIIDADKQTDKKTSNHSANTDKFIAVPSGSGSNKKTKSDRNRFQNFDYSKINFSKFMSDSKVQKSVKTFSIQMRKTILARKQKRRYNVKQKQ